MIVLSYLDQYFDVVIIMQGRNNAMAVNPAPGRNIIFYPGVGAGYFDPITDGQLADGIL